jgi:hypothetical protein
MKVVNCERCDVPFGSTVGQRRDHAAVPMRSAGHALPILQYERSGKHVSDRISHHARSELT